MQNIQYEDMVKIRDCYDIIIQNFPDDLSLIDDVIKDKDDVVAIEMISHLNTFLLNDLLNKSHLFSESELEYLSHVRTYNAKKATEIRNIKDAEFLSKKGKLTNEQIEKYSTKLPKVEKEKIERFDAGERTKTFDAGLVAGIVIGFLATAVVTLILSTLDII